LAAYNHPRPEVIERVRLASLARCAVVNCRGARRPRRAAKWIRRWPRAPHNDKSHESLAYSENSPPRPLPPQVA
jgi:hypothetical protein